MNYEEEALKKFVKIATKYGYEVMKGQGSSNRICSNGKVYFQFGDLRVETKDYTLVIEAESAGGVTNLVKYWYALKNCREDIKKPLILFHIYHQNSPGDYKSHLDLWDFLWEVMKKDVGDMMVAYRYTYTTEKDLEKAMHHFEDCLKDSFNCVSVTDPKQYSVSIDKEIYEQVTHFKKIIDAVIGEEMKGMDDYINLVLKIGMQRMLSDVLPENEALQSTMVAMFQDNPGYICDFISRKIKESSKEAVKDKTSEWMNAYR